MSSIQLKQTKHHHSDNPSGIFANRNTLYRRFHQIHQIKQPVKGQTPKPDDNKFQVFKNKLMEYLSSEKEKSFEQQTVGIGRSKGRPGKVNRNKNYQSTYISRQSPQQRYLRSSSLEGKGQGPKKINSRSKQTKIRIHTNYPQKFHKVSKKPNVAGSLDAMHQRSKTTQNCYMDVHNRSVPICTINFVDLRKSDTTNQNKTVYHSYLHSKLGFTPQRQENQLVQSNLSQKLLNFKTSKSKTVIANQAGPSQVLVMDGSEDRILQVEKSKSELLNNRIVRKKPKPMTMKISINNVQNILGPWTKKGLYEEQEDQHCDL